MRSIMIARIKKFPLHGWIGLGLILIFWPLNWFAPGAIKGLGFFPLWLGYILLMDGLVFHRKRSSLFSRSWGKFILLFLLSIPLWWTGKRLIFKSGVCGTGQFEFFYCYSRGSGKCGVCRQLFNFIPAAARPQIGSWTRDGNCGFPEWLVGISSVIAVASALFSPGVVINLFYPGTD